MNHFVIESERLCISPKSIEEMEALCNIEADPELKKAYSEMLNAMLKLNITAQTEPDNTISQTVLLKNGFFRDGYGDEGPLYKVGR